MVSGTGCILEREGGLVHSGYGFDSLAERRPSFSNVDPWAKARGPREPKIFKESTR